VGNVEYPCVVTDRQMLVEYACVPHGHVITGEFDHLPVLFMIVMQRSPLQHLFGRLPLLLCLKSQEAARGGIQAALGEFAFQFQDVYLEVVRRELGVTLPACVPQRLEYVCGRAEVET
jgi:hypothetical protein